MPFDRIADRKIREAMANGEFDGLGARGAIDLNDYFMLPAEIRAAYSLLKNAGVVPQEVEYLKEVDRLQAAHDGAAAGAERAVLARQLAEARLRLSLALERRKQSRDASP